MQRKKIKKVLRVSALTVVVIGVWVLGLRAWTHNAYSSRVYQKVEDVPTENEPRIAIVFGAGLWPGGPSPVLYDRVVTAVDLYKAGKVHKLLMTGDNRFQNYNEPAVMRQTALTLGVPDQDIVLDYAGRRTYDSCCRAHEIFGIRRAILVTQAFHLDRALYLCHSFDIDAIGITADRQAYPPGSRSWWSIREFPATTSAWLDVNLLHPTPILGEKIPIR